LRATFILTADFLLATVCGRAKEAVENNAKLKAVTTIIM